jgi:hypothetical protein
VRRGADTGVALLAKYQKKLQVLSTQKEKRKLSLGLMRGSSMMQAVDNGLVVDANMLALMDL